MIIRQIIAGAILITLRRYSYNSHYIGVYGRISMPIQRSGPKVETRLSSKDFGRFSAIARDRQLTKSEVAREAILEYMDRHEKGLASHQEEIYAQELRSMANRLAAMLYRLQLECGFLVTLHMDMIDDKTLDSAQNRTKDRIRRRLSKDEEDLKSRTAKVITSERKVGDS